MGDAANTPPAPSPPPEPSGLVADASRRTYLANERTFLAWLRTGLTAFAVALGVGQVVPALSDVSGWPYVVVGVGFALLGVAVVLYGLVRTIGVDRALADGRPMDANGLAVGLVTSAVVLLGAALVVLLIVYG